MIFFEHFYKQFAYCYYKKKYKYLLFSNSNKGLIKNTYLQFICLKVFIKKVIISNLLKEIKGLKVVRVYL